MYDGPVRLPSGATVHVRVPEDVSPVADDVIDGRPIFGGRLFAAVERDALVVEQEGRRLDRDALLDLSLRDYHALRDVAERLGAIAADPPELDCRNCGTPLRIDPTAAPTEDLDTWYAEDHSPDLPEGRVVMEPVTVRRALPLWQALMRERPSITPPIVRALGLRAIDAERRPGRLARMLEDASDELWDRIAARFVLLNYADRATFPVVCPACGAVHDAPAPSLQELEAPPEAVRELLAETPSEGAAAGGFPDADDFVEMVERIGEEVYAARGVRNIPLIVDRDVPPVDGSGEPLLGSYAPIHSGDAAGYTRLAFEIRLYYRSFRGLWEQDGPYDVEAEIRETIDHEVEHHLHFLAGHDPMDEAEREEALQELERTFGPRAVRRARRTALLSELRGIVLMLVVVALVLGATVVALRLLGVLHM